MDDESDPEARVSPLLNIAAVALFGLPLLAWLYSPLVGVYAIGFSMSVLGIITVLRGRIAYGSEWRAHLGYIEGPAAVAIGLTVVAGGLFVLLEAPSILAYVLAHSASGGR
ncbi:MAG TPA: hypothetical protein VKS60_26115 [Stellaceae bacterium]|nr:hypothetical protein [Stellaceae bacterium]